MKIGMVLLCLIPTWAIADIYKSIDVDGHVTYSSAPIRGGKRVVASPAAPKTRPEHPGSAPMPATLSQGFPKVNEETQRGRDDRRHKILRDELKTEEALLSTARMQVTEINRSNPGDNDKRKELNSQVNLHTRNIEALKTELSK